MSDLILSENNFGDKIYGRFPAKYREDDLNQNQALYRYIQSLSDGGFSEVIKDINNLLNFLDYSNAPQSVLPIALKQYGINFEGLENVPVKYLKRVYKAIGELVNSRGCLKTLEYFLCVVFDVDAIGVDPKDYSRFIPALYLKIYDAIGRTRRGSGWVKYPYYAEIGSPFKISATLQSVEEIGDFENALEFSKATRNLIHQFLPYIFKDEYRIIYRYKEDKKVLSADKQSTVIYKKLTQMSSTTINGVTFYPYEVNGILYYIEDSSEPLHLRNKFRGTT